MVGFAQKENKGSDFFCTSWCGAQGPPRSSCESRPFVRREPHRWASGTGWPGPPQACCYMYIPVNLSQQYKKATQNHTYNSRSHNEPGNVTTRSTALDSTKAMTGAREIQGQMDALRTIGITSTTYAIWRDCLQDAGDSADR